jgi:uncharacterized protein YbbC (DUF1343 family)
MLNMIAAQQFKRLFWFLCHCMKNIFLATVLLLITLAGTAQKKTAIVPGAGRPDMYLPLLQGKRVAVFANNTSMIGPVHLVDTLQRLHIQVVKIFAPEHGFRGDEDAGASVASYTDKRTGIAVVSLYGKKVKPSADDLRDVDVLLFDIQDVGVRFYTYISSLQYYMEAAFENDKLLVILDRPNPNGFYIDGPVLDTAYKSFIGMQPVPVVYGMTIGEYALMLAGEQWLSKKANENYAAVKKKQRLRLTVIPCKNYTHSSRYALPEKPSPNLPDMHSVYAYPSTCFFEGTTLSEGRGTVQPFCIFGHPALPKNLFRFTPVSTTGAKNPKWKDKDCYGWNITDSPVTTQLELKWLLNAYNAFPQKDSFFLAPSAKDPVYFFDKLAGAAALRLQVQQGKSEAEIRKSWQPALDKFKLTRKKYLLYQ